MANDSKKEAFRKYLESSGVLDAVTKVLVTLYEEPDKPAIANDFLRNNLGAPTATEYEQLRQERDDLQAKYDDLQARHAEALQKLEQLQQAPVPDAESPEAAAQ
eukprot:TRINITY_DN18017_c1_g1_i1.p2 TRINITY_DN18017_c1_g1~~TRINITY_DN18017_c1_g1_i1.p2  ORF type:complete len:104 (+),score=23.30 TRINITY_DN18017_c1_g1_i1:76-387(+)